MLFPFHTFPPNFSRVVPFSYAGRIAYPTLKKYKKYDTRWRPLRKGGMFGLEKDERRGAEPRLFKGRGGGKVGVSGARSLLKQN